ncbi:sodium:proton antiporter [candidate division KSB1 bacterium]
MRFGILLCLIVLMVLSASSAAYSQEEEHHEYEPSAFLILPFILMLGSIAVIPLVREHWWENNWNKLIVAAVLGIPIGVFYVFVDLTALEHSMLEYFSFIVYVGSLFVISGGIVLRGDLKVSPSVNLAFLATGASLASFIGTPGASMLLIRPLLRINEGRRTIKHVVIFFIFSVSNIGGCLTPLGDPPLFLGYLRGVPFTWTFNLWPAWLMANILLLTGFYFMDRHLFKTDPHMELQRRTPGDKHTPLSLTGLINFLWLGGVVCSVAFLDLGMRELAMVLVVVMSIITTPKGLREENRFTYHPVIEVAFLFIGIFLTMIPALQLLKAYGPTLAEKGLTEPWMFFWFTGSLSAFLDNAPTYLTFFTLAQGLGATENLVAATEVSYSMLEAISLGAVFMGAVTYIGNGPNFMVKAIADESGTKMPTFLGYMLWALVILIPLFILMTFMVFIFHIL